MNKERQRKLAARARRMESLHPTSTIAIQTNDPEPTVDVKPTMVKKTEKKQKIKSGSTQKEKKATKDVSVKASVKKPKEIEHKIEHKKKHNSKGVK